MNYVKKKSIVVQRTLCVLFILLFVFHLWDVDSETSLEEIDLESKTKTPIPKKKHGRQLSTYSVDFEQNASLVKRGIFTQH